MEKSEGVERESERKHLRRRRRDVVLMFPFTEYSPTADVSEHDGPLFV